MISIVFLFFLVDIVSAIEFDETGDFLAVGDRGGRVVVFEQDANDYKFYAEFQSHEPEFDYLKSLEIEEKINKIKWCKRTNDSHFLLTTNGLYTSFHISIQILYYFFHLYIKSLNLLFFIIFFLFLFFFFFFI